mgnify:CR=1 FL=1
MDEKQLNEYLNIFKQKYSIYLFNTLVSMLAINPSNRRKASDIYNELYPNEDQILNIEPFNPPQFRQSTPYGQGQPLPFIMQAPQGQAPQRATYQQPVQNVYPPGYRPI